MLVKDLDGDGAISVENEVIGANVFYQGDEIGVIVKIPPREEGVYWHFLDMELNASVCTKKHVTRDGEAGSASRNTTAFSINNTFSVSWLMQFYEGNNLEVGGTREYLVRSFLGEDSQTPFAEKKFFVNFDLKAEDIRR